MTQHTHDRPAIHPNGLRPLWWRHPLAILVMPYLISAAAWAFAQLLFWLIDTGVL